MITFSALEVDLIYLLGALLTLPSILSLSCGSLIMWSRVPLTKPGLISHPSTVKHLRFDHCVLDLEALAEILANATNLESFAYNYNFGVDPAVATIETYGPSTPGLHTAPPVYCKHNWSQLGDFGGFY